MACGVLMATEEDENKLNGFISSIGSSVSGLGGMGEGMGTMVGVVAEKYKYSLKLLNESPIPLNVATYRITPALGADVYTNDLLNETTVVAGSDSGDFFKDQQLKFTIKVRENSTSGRELLMRRETELGDTEAEGYYDTNYIRGYVHGGDIRVEYLGPMIQDTNFVGTFYNNTDDQVKVTFQKGVRTYSNISLDPHSFNLINSDEEAPIRPSDGEQRSLQFNSNGVTVTKPISAEGISGVPYIYEIYKKDGQLNVHLQGFTLGNFDQMPLNASGQQDPSRFRDVNPVPCSIWLKSAVQGIPPAEGETAPLYFDEPYETWAIYKTSDYSVRVKLETGKSTDFNLIRPSIEQKTGILYVVRVFGSSSQTQSFLDRLARGDVGFDSPYVDATRIPRGDITLSLFPSDAGLIEDGGVKAALLMTDVYLPMGIGSSRMYYMIEPTILQPDDLALKITEYLTDEFRTQAIVDEIKAAIPSWIMAYAQSQSTQPIQDYLQGKLINSAIPTSILTGPLSVKNYPALRFAGMNFFATPIEGIDVVEHVTA